MNWKSKREKAWKRTRKDGSEREKAPKRCKRTLNFLTRLFGQENLNPFFGSSNQKKNVHNKYWFAEAVDWINDLNEQPVNTIEIKRCKKTPFAPFQLKFINIKVHRWHGRYWIGKMFILSIELKGAKHFLFTHAAKLAKVIMWKNKLDWTWTKVNKKWTEFSANIPVSCIILTQFTLRMTNYLFKSVCCALPPLKQIDLIGWINQLMLISAVLEQQKKSSLTAIDEYCSQWIVITPDIQLPHF